MCKSADYTKWAQWLVRVETQSRICNGCITLLGEPDDLLMFHGCRCAGTSRTWRHTRTRQRLRTAWSAGVEPALTTSFRTAREARGSRATAKLRRTRSGGESAGPAALNFPNSACKLAGECPRCDAVRILVGVICTEVTIFANGFTLDCKCSSKKARHFSTMHAPFRGAGYWAVWPGSNWRFVPGAVHLEQVLLGLSIEGLIRDAQTDCIRRQAGRVQHVPTSQTT